ncbi:hypothetical protein [Parapedobacter sp. 2B3]|uniref:hypothetical protein n=1 Tax=Parapedobacter sp. 2B3 TaxID=3342381 RepID=UPI0035B65F86
MNRFKTYLALSVLPLSFTMTVSAQSVDQGELQATVRSIGQLVTDLGDELGNVLKSIDVEALARDAEKLASLSEQRTREITRELEQVELTPLIRESESLAQEIAQLDWQRLLEQPDAMMNFGYQKEKVTEYSYPINSRQSVNIDNRYGKITINNWAKNEVKVVVTIRTAEDSERRAQEALDRVHINQSQSGNAISFKTAIESGDSNWWSMLTSGGGDRALRVDYDIYLPKRNELVLANRYGAIELSDRDGKVDVSVSYGSLHAGHLNGVGNSLSVAYSKAAVEYLNEGDVSVRYGGFTLSEAEKLTLAMSYSSSGKIGKINQRADISLRYSSGFEMGLGPAIQKASVAASYSNIHIRPASDAAFNFDVAVSYGGFDYDRNHINIGSKSESHTSASYSGYWNKAVDNVVSVSARYGAVSLK